MVMQFKNVCDGNQGKSQELANEICEKRSDDILVKSRIHSLIFEENVR